MALKSKYTLLLIISFSIPAIPVQLQQGEEIVQNNVQGSTLNQCLNVESRSRDLGVCFGNELLNNLHQYDEQDSFSLANGVSLVRDEKTPRDFDSLLDKDPLDFRSIMEGASSLISKRSLHWDMSVLHPGLVMRIGPTLANGILEFVMDPRIKDRTYQGSEELSTGSVLELFVVGVPSAVKPVSTNSTRSRASRRGQPSPPSTIFEGERRPGPNVTVSKDLKAMHYYSGYFCRLLAKNLLVPFLLGFKFQLSTLLPLLLGLLLIASKKAFFLAKLAIIAVTVFGGAGAFGGGGFGGFGPGLSSYSSPYLSDQGGHWHGHGHHGEGGFYSSRPQPHHDYYYKEKSSEPSTASPITPGELRDRLERLFVTKNENQPREEKIRDARNFAWSPVVG